MHVIAPHLSAISLFSHAGLVRRFASKKETVSELGYSWISQYVGSHFREFSHRERLYSERHPDGYRYTAVYTIRPYILRDELGTILRAGDFPRPYIPRGRWRYLAFNFWNGAGPVPYTGKRGRFKQSRHPGTQPARREAAYFPEYGEPRIRAKRKAIGAPTAWDNLRRADIEDRSWKRNRAHQWKAVL